MAMGLEVINYLKILSKESNIAMRTVFRSHGFLRNQHYPDPDPERQIKS